ncbi:unnamed protein product [Anisakis simplex]|uniref:Fibronectin type III domain-containing protein 3B n=1 Tax=Anisakis simplex TaxID=6269 RepID=A0A0M3K2N7_ANISI|nr:unnamed protein product [Anisakis simplex]
MKNVDFSDVPVNVKSGWPVAHSVLLNNGLAPVYMSCNTVPTSSSSPTPLYSDHGRPIMAPNLAQRAPLPMSSNDLFVHIQTGEVLSILVGNDVQHIAGPATVRMVNQAGMSPSALPLHVPPGHMVQQIVDEQGILRHLILSPETTPTSRINAVCTSAPSTINTTPSSNPISNNQMKTYLHQSPSPPVVPPYPPPNIPFTAPSNTADLNEEGMVRKSWVPHGKKASSSLSATHLNGAHLIHVPYATADEHEQSQSGASANEEEEWERLIEMLSRMQPPQILRVAAKEADISWQELDTSEASANGGPFPQIDASEFTYEIVLFESVQNGRIVSSYRCEPDSGNRVRLCRLRPNTDYYVHLRASLEERCLQGSPSSAVKFRTLCTVPECPQPPRLISKTQHSLTIAWRPAIDNGSPIILYRIQIAVDKNEEENENDYEVVYEGLSEQTTIKGLLSSTRYKIRLIAINSEGESQPSASFTIVTCPIHPPKQPLPPKLVSLSSNTVKLSWVDIPQHYYTLEMSDATRSKEFTSVCERAQQSSANITDLSSNHVYHFRLIAHNDAGASDVSEALIVRIPQINNSDTNENNNNNGNSNNITPPDSPLKPFIISNVKSRVEIGWNKLKSNGNNNNVNFVLEGSYNEQQWNVLYKGSATSALVRDGQLNTFRVAAIRKQIQSEWSEILKIKREQPTSSSSSKQQQQQMVSVGKCSKPKINEVSKGCIRVEWQSPLQKQQQNLLSRYDISYQLRRINVQPTKILYQGESTSFDIKECKAGDEFELDVRAILAERDGASKRIFEGEWSDMAALSIPIQAPSPPQDISLDSKFIIHWNKPANDNGASITQYLIERTLLKSSSTSAKSTTRNDEKAEEKEENGWMKRYKRSDESNEEYVGDGKPGCRYQLCVYAINQAGTSLPSECVYVTIPTMPPSIPQSFSVAPQGCRQLRASWRAAPCNGSEVIEYVINVIDEKKGEQIRTIRIADDFECSIDGLESDHMYKIDISAVNSVGKGEVATCVVSTLPPPPPPPQLICSEAGPSYLKLKWKHSPNICMNTTPSLYYYLEKENDSGKFSPIYEGDNRYAKVRSLNENSKYRFRIRCLSRESGMGEWSSAYEFETEQHPPPTIRGNIIVNEISSNNFQVEWPPLKSISSLSSSLNKNNDINSTSDHLFYRLQLSNRSNPTSKSSTNWKTVHYLNFDFVGQTLVI